MPHKAQKVFFLDNSHPSPIPESPFSLELQAEDLQEPQRGETEWNGVGGGPEPERLQSEGKGAKTITDM